MISWWQKNSEKDKEIAQLKTDYSYLRKDFENYRDDTGLTIGRWSKLVQNLEKDISTRDDLIAKLREGLTKVTEDYGASIDAANALRMTVCELKARYGIRNSLEEKNEALRSKLEQTSILLQQKVAAKEPGKTGTKKGSKWSQARRDAFLLKKVKVGTKNDNAGQVQTQMVSRATLGRY